MIRVLTSDRDLNAKVRLPIPSNRWTTSDGVDVYFASVDQVVRLAQAFFRLRKHHPEILYYNSFFSAKLSVLPQFLGLLAFWGSARRLVAPRGEFGEGALRRRSLKKRIFMFAYRVAGLHRGVYWHASSEAEAFDIAAVWGETAQILVREDETGLPAAPLAVVEDAREHPGLRGIFLGRIVEHKGLLILLKGLAEIAAPVRLDVYGPLEDKSYAEQCRQAATRMPSNVVVTFKGPVRPEDVRSTIGAYDVLFMPTAGENFGHIVAESLSASCPVVCTPFTPWGSVLLGGGGVLVKDRSIDSWAKALKDYANLNREELGSRRISAGLAYSRWWASAKSPHVLEIFAAGESIASVNFHKSPERFER
ncbi:glycosyltransferase [Cryobacterium sp. TMT2-23]|uniref:glycosyltransferase n=1 Tax=Cryobacterium sp. TMT2-23 TaxID=1259252 RepID=UPI00141B65A9|nr:glycosyltransferase [Cryobacterium sp. TMT2-23]